MLTARGQAKILDFGLARLGTHTKLTKADTTLGTVAYMSPEQSSGKDVDRRTDIWSLGVVLYEMITGQRPFAGEYEAAVVHSILNDAPEPVTARRSNVPMELERIVTKCLEKNRDERYQTAADLIADLRHLQRTLSTGTEAAQRSVARAGKPARKVRWWYWAVPVIVIAIIAAVVFLKMPRRAVNPEEKSIAVLPFVDMSPERDQEYFCDGMTEELINRLSHIQALRVPARTSTFMFKGKTEDIRDIGSKLNVQAVLEGSVRKAGSELRITAQLINVADGYHIWSETYDRELENVFAIQDEISSAIVNALQLKLTPQEIEKISERPIDNVKAYECYLKARRQIRGGDEKSVDSALVYLQTGIDIMGDNAVLYSGMAFACWQYANLGIRREDYRKRGEEYAKKALALKPDLASALNVLGMLCDFEDYPKNLHDNFRYGKKALAADPNDTGTLDNLAWIYRYIGKPSEAAALAERAERLDPLNPWYHVGRGHGYWCDCQFGPALEEFRAFYRADSTNPVAQINYSVMLAYNGKRDEALAVIDRMGTTSAANMVTVMSLLLKYALLEDKESALRVLTPEAQKTCRRDWEMSYWVANMLSLVGAKEEALDWLENAINRGYINYPLFRCDPFLDNIRGEERFEKIMEHAKYEWEHFEVPE